MKREAVESFSIKFLLQPRQPFPMRTFVFGGDEFKTDADARRPAVDFARIARKGAC